MILSPAERGLLLALLDDADACGARQRVEIALLRSQVQTLQAQRPRKRK